MSSTCVDGVSAFVGSFGGGAVDRTRAVPRGCSYLRNMAQNAAGNHLFGLRGPGLLCGTEYVITYGYKYMYVTSGLWAAGAEMRSAIIALEPGHEAERQPQKFGTYHTKLRCRSEHVHQKQSDYKSPVLFQNTSVVDKAVSGTRRKPNTKNGELARHQPELIKASKLLNTPD